MNLIVVPQIEYLEDVLVQFFVVWSGEEVYPGYKILNIYNIMALILIIGLKEETEDPVCPNTLKIELRELNWCLVLTCKAQNFSKTQ